MAEQKCTGARCPGFTFRDLSGAQYGDTGVMLAADVKFCPRCGAPRPPTEPEMSQDEREALEMINALRISQGARRLKSLDDAMTLYTKNALLELRDEAVHIFAAPRDKMIEERDQEIRELNSSLQETLRREANQHATLTTRVADLVGKLKASDDRNDILERANQSLQDEVNQPRITRLVEACQEKDKAIAEQTARIAELENELASANLQLSAAPKPVPPLPWTKEQREAMALRILNAGRAFRQAPLMVDVGDAGFVIGPQLAELDEAEHIFGDEARRLQRELDGSHEVINRLGRERDDASAELAKLKSEKAAQPAAGGWTTRMLEALATPRMSPDQFDAIMVCGKLDIAENAARVTAAMREENERLRRLVRVTKDWVPLLGYDEHMALPDPKCGYAPHRDATAIDEAMKAKAARLLKEAGLA